MPRIIAGLRSDWGASAPAARTARAVFPPALALDPLERMPWGPGGLHAPGERRGAWARGPVADRLRRVPWVPYPARAGSGTVAPWVRPGRGDSIARVPWSVYPHRLMLGQRAPWVRPDVRDRMLRVVWGLYRPQGRHLEAAIPAARPLDGVWRIIFGRYVKRYYTAIAGGVFPLEPFGVVPAQRSYIVINDVSLVRVSDSAAIPAFGLQIDCDTDTGLIGWSATVQGSALDLVEPPGAGEPVEVQAAINGDVFRLLVEQIQRDRAFPTSRLQLSGRGIAARLAAPYAAEVSRDNTAGALTAAQLAVDALTINATPIGWDIDMGLTDWLVPAGAWAHTGTHFAAVQAIAAAAGGYVRADRVAQTLYLRPRWPVLPWELAAATPDIVLPDAAVARESLRWVERPEYDGVYVSGESQGVLALCRRTGFAGDLLAPMAVDPLITHDDAARQRALAEIGIPGRSALLRLDLQVLPATGVIEIGTILQFTDGATPRIGIVRSVSVRYQHPTLRQSVELECHA